MIKIYEMCIVVFVLKRTLEEKKASRDEALSAEKSSMFAVKEKTLKLELFSKASFLVHAVFL